MARDLKILIYGYGNPGRQDDGLGVLLVEQINTWIELEGYTFIETDSNYQLNIEDASVINEKDLVIFADASKEDLEYYSFTEILPDAKVDFTMHHVSPSFVLHLSQEIYGKIPDTFLIHVKGYEWEFMKEPTKKALDNLNRAIVFLKNYLMEYITINS